MKMRALPAALAATMLLFSVSVPLLVGCNKSSPTEPTMAASMAGTWTGTYASTDAIDCNNTISYPALVTISQNGSVLSGTLTATGDPSGCPCGNLSFTGTVQGNLFSGDITAPVAGWHVRGALTGSMEIDLLGVPLNTFGVFHLHQ